MKAVLRLSLLIVLVVCSLSLAARRGGGAGPMGMRGGFGGAPAQPVPGIAPSTNLNPNGYPRVLPENRVVFQLRAPQASQIQIDLGRRYDMERNDQGIWTVTTDPQDPGFHYYMLIVDGVSVADPASEIFYGASRLGSAIDIPEEGVDFYDVKDVPHGDMRQERYFSKVTNSWRRLFVYAPPGYDKNTDTRYPVLYIQHGGGEDETGWAVQGKTDIVLDNLIAEGKAVPMLVVISNGDVSSPGGGGGYSRAGMAGFADELINNIVPFIDKTYRTEADARHRALSGLSMGGGQTFYVGLDNKDKFASLGIFSTGLFGGISRGGTGGGFDAETQMPGLLTDSQSFNDALDVFYISVGQQDPRFEATKAIVQKFRENGLEVEFNSFPGAHEWQVWRKSLHDFASRLFK